MVTYLLTLDLVVFGFVGGAAAAVVTTNALAFAPAWPLGTTFGSAFTFMLLCDWGWEGGCGCCCCVCGICFESGDSGGELSDNGEAAANEAGLSLLVDIVPPCTGPFCCSAEVDASKAAFDDLACFSDDDPVPPLVILLLLLNVVLLDTGDSWLVCTIIVLVVAA